MIIVGVERMPWENFSEVFSYSAPVSMILFTSSRRAGSFAACSVPYFLARAARQAGSFREENYQ
jgi:hypothetical protein